MKKNLLVNMPDAERMYWRDVIESAGGHVDAYQEDCFLVAVPRETNAFFNGIEDNGMETLAGSRHYFPLGTDSPPDNLRHDASYPGSKGFWLYIRVRPIPVEHDDNPGWNRPGYLTNA